MTGSTLTSTPFTAESTAADVIEGIDLTGRRAVVTGGASGIGVETARALAGAGADVTIAVRDMTAGERTALDIAVDTGREITVTPLDLTDRSSISAFVAAWSGPLHILVDNAGVMASPLARTPEGWEVQFATNHLGHFALACGLHRNLVAADGARIVSVSSSAHLRAGVDFDDVHFERREYDPWVAYGQSKTADVLLAVEATKRWGGEGITANALMPGVIRTNLQRHVDEAELDRILAAAGSSAASWKTPQQGAATSVLLAASPLVEGVSGRYFEDCAEAAPNEPGTRTGVAAHALDPEAAARLWDLSVRTLA
ncbi:SDR family NAD(P)-dependent oxidoreductase [Pseudonocardia humida]|uniref:SDR family NAD(P)-dependent oxidoreductase n=1 Tax=Pseudonocardia humida TaxID=2800819 RepID=A0ABT1A8W1_9PSEU|nr:SDR family NAD(P)-dependent oxidoreductase [Pseudonocardia humida]MCO1659475.1 SDR family NAD(P)-dependent oxidoreductase [Pseudonocardia humida]